MNITVKILIENVDRGTDIKGLWEEINKAIQIHVPYNRVKVFEVNTDE